MKGGGSLPTNVGPTSIIPDRKIKAPQRLEKNRKVDPNTYSNGLRNYNDIVNSGAYEKSDYKPTLRSKHFNLLHFTKLI
jgi:hypothetical protein